MNQMQDETVYWVSLQLIQGLGGQGICKLLQVFGSPALVFEASHQELCAVVSENIAHQIIQGPNFELAQATLDWLQLPGNHMITLADNHYPQKLLEIPDPPPVLYAKGNLACLSMPAIAIVGSRNASVQGEKNAEAFAQALAIQGLCVVSGMALGIDAAAHRGALQASQKTIAVVGTGLDIVYPAKHRDLAHQIAGQGLILSEFPLGTPSRPQNFPRRNRIISGLSLGCLVVEANVQSGSLITARLATEQGRDVFAIPGSIHSPMSKGCHALIKQGAKLVDHIKDITDELASYLTQQYTPEISIANPVEEEDALLSIMGFDPMDVELLIERSNLTGKDLSAKLLMLELENKIASLPGGRYQRIV
jgi:DNA processing protein